jgi:hypothetical protein
MSDTPSKNTSTTTTFSRKACLSDFFDTPIQNKHTQSQNDSNTIAKNQQEFGHRKRIKP